jgi:hypothetical protein
MILIGINSIQFYGILEQAIDEYKAKLKNDEELQCHFIDAWQSIENHVQDVTTIHKVSAKIISAAIDLDFKGMSLRKLIGYSKQLQSRLY